MHLLTIRASDKGTNPLNTAGNDATVKVVVTDYNDNAPEFEAVDKIILPEDEAQPKVILTLKANDLDSNNNAAVMYALTSGNEDGKFAVNMVSFGPNNACILLSDSTV